MSEEISVNLEESACYMCKTPMNSVDVYCPECGFPENGTDQDKSKFHAQSVLTKSRQRDAAEKIKSARNVLYVIAGIVLIFGFISFFMNQDMAVLVTNVILGIIYLLLASWTSKKPLAAILLGLLLYLTTIVISAIFDPSTIVRGIIFKILIVAYLAKGVYSASSIKK